MVNVVNGANKILCSDGTTQVAVGEKVTVISERDKTELQNTRNVVTGTLVSFVESQRRPITEAELTGQAKYSAERAKDSAGYTMYNNHQVEVPNQVEFLTIRKENGCHVSIRGFRILSISKVVEVDDGE